MGPTRAAYLSGLATGASIFAFISFGSFHLINSLGLIQSELAWGIIQLCSAGIVGLMAWLTHRSLPRA